MKINIFHSFPVTNKKKNTANQQGVTHVKNYKTKRKIFFCKIAKKIMSLLHEYKKKERKTASKAEEMLSFLQNSSIVESVYASCLPGVFSQLCLMPNKGYLRERNVAAAAHTAIFQIDRTR